MRRPTLVLALLFAGPLLALSACDSRTPETKKPVLAAADCCQCVTAGSATKASTPVACVTGVTDANKCSQTCAPNVGGIMQGSCKDSIRCQ